VPPSIPGNTGRLLVFAVALLVAVELLSQLQAMSKDLLEIYTTERLSLQFRSLLFRHAQRLSLSYHDRRGSADANYRIQKDAAAIPTIAVEGIMPFLTAIVTFGAMLAVMMAIEKTVAWIALGVMPVSALLTWGYQRRLRVRHREVKALESSAFAVVQEVLGSIRVVKAFGQEEREEQRFAQRADEGVRARVRVAFVDGSFWVGIVLINALGTGAVLYVGTRSVLNGTISVGSLLLIMVYLSKLYGPLYTMTRQVASLQSNLASAERAFTLLDQEQDVPERPDAIPLPRATGAVEFRNVTFAYDGAPPVIEGVSFAVRPGMRVGITGRTGAGKTTLMGLLTRFYDPTSGSILLDGMDLRDYRLEDLRNQFAIVLQEPVLFSTTIGENIAYGRPGASSDEIVAAATAAGVHDFIIGQPKGYDTPVGERGLTLSGGERQRISLARAFLKDAPILILDEPTSSVDLNTEAAIIDAMERLMAGRTSFMIAHRVGTLERCTLRLKVSRGTVSVEGIADECVGARSRVPQSRP
jgi:ATP-binding cassette subfamily B protein